MPIREYSCGNPACENYGRRRERYERTTPPPAPVCGCGEMMAQLASSFGVVFAGAMTARYNDKSKENAHVEGQWMLEKKAPGGQKWTHVEDWATRKRIMKQEGLVDGGQAEVSSDGKSVSTAGMSGQWI